MYANVSGKYIPGNKVKKFTTDFHPMTPNEMIGFLPRTITKAPSLIIGSHVFRNGSMKNFINMVRQKIFDER